MSSETLYLIADRARDLKVGKDPPSYFLNARGDARDYVTRDPQKMKTKIITILCAAATLAATSATAGTHPDPAAVATDAVVGRPIGLAATVIGSVFFVVSLPFAATSGSIRQSADLLV